MTENARLTGMPIRNSAEVLPNAMERIVYPVESAALINGPLPQGQGYTPSIILKTLLHLMLILQSSAAQLKKNGTKASAAFATHSKNLSKNKQITRMEQQTLSRIAMQLLLKQPP